MMSKIIIKIIALSTCGLSLTAPCASAISDKNTSYVYVVYDAGDGTFGNNIVRKTIPTRKGTRWSRRMTSEIPENPIRNSFNFDKWTINGESIQDTYVFNKDITITATYTVTSSKGNWGDDSWAQLATEASKGLDTLKITYAKKWAQGPTEDEPKKVANSFIGSEHNVKYNGLDYKARVIGMNHDTLSSDHTTKAALTFEVVELINNISYSGYSTNNNIYETCNLRNSLNTTVLNLFEANLRDYVKPVDKRTHKGGGGSKYGNIGTYSEKLFAPSLQEMNIKSDVPHYIQDEGTAYDYYQQHSTVSDRIRYVTISGKSVAAAYWTRSPDVETKYYAWHINDEGKVGDYDSLLQERSPMDVRTSSAVSVCFAL